MNNIWIVYDKYKTIIIINLKIILIYLYLYVLYKYKIFYQYQIHFLKIWLLYIGGTGKVSYSIYLEYL